MSKSLVDFLSVTVGVLLQPGEAEALVAPVLSEVAVHRIVLEEVRPIIYLCSTESAVWSNWILHRKMKYYVCSFIQGDPSPWGPGLTWIWDVPQAIGLYCSYGAAQTRQWNIPNPSQSNPGPWGDGSPCRSVPISHRAYLIQWSPLIWSTFWPRKVHHISRLTL